MKKYKKILILSLSLYLIAGCSQNKLYSEKKLLLGTIVEVTSPYPEAAKIAFKEIERIEKIFSIFIDSSSISHLNKTGFLNTNFEVAFLIENARIFSQLTKGQFDITIGPLSDIWKKAIKEEKVPQQKEIEDALKLVNFDKIIIDKSDNIKFLVKGMKVDLGGIAKGYAVDMAIKELKRNGINSALVNAGGNLYCLGSKFDKPWKVGVQHPRKVNEMLNNLELVDLAVSTSGDYQQYFQVGSKRYSHIIDPKTGYPVENNIISVTVVAKDAMTADAVSTCVFLLGEEEGKRLFKYYKGVEKIIAISKSDIQNN